MVAGNPTLRAIFALLSLGALGVSTALAAAPETLAKPDGGAARDVAGRLQSIRRAVSELAVDQSAADSGNASLEKVWWGNWHGGWHNGGWGWHNGGWRNGGWPNWHNGWGNGGWQNFWRNW